MIPITKPFLPPIADYQKRVADIWTRQWLTNNGPLVNELEIQLKDYLSVPQLLFVSNGTIAIQMAIKALELTGEIITTPFSYVATTSSIVWEGCTPIFVDIDPETFNIDPSKIVAAITPQTSAILATHVYGNPCAVEEIQSIADAHGLKVIYDAAHAFGTQYDGRSLFEYGDLSTTSFHATKLFHTTEGGAVICNSTALAKKLGYLRNFGHDGPEKFADVGINGKNSEFHAAMGLCNLPHMPAILEKRKNLCQYYDHALRKLNHQKQKITPNTLYNHAYYPILLPTEALLLRMVDELQKNWIYPRRYFYPSLHTLRYVRSEVMPVSSDISARILCLPLYHELTHEDIDLVARILIGVQNG